MIKLFGLMRVKDHEAEMAETDAEIDKYWNRYVGEQERATRLARKALEVTRERDVARAGRDAAHAALAQIVGMATPNCAHIGKRMALRAWGALPFGGSERPAFIVGDGGSGFIGDGGSSGIAPASAGSSVNVN